MFGVFKKRLHESVAAAAVLSISIALHSAWIIHLLFTKSPRVAEALNIAPSIGAVSGMYTLVAFVFLGSFGAGTLWFRGKDLTEFRARLFWFFVISLILFFVLTHPLVYTFEIQPTAG